MKEVPVWEKTTLTLEEAAAYTGIGENRLRVREASYASTELTRLS
jgi:hypothetical protein